MDEAMRRGSVRITDKFYGSLGTFMLGHNLFKTFAKYVIAFSISIEFWFIQTVLSVVSVR